MDIRVTWNQIAARCDWSIVNNDLATGGDLESAVLISLFTDALSDPDFVPPDQSGDQRGWWGDAYDDTPLGSRLWQLDRSKIGNRQALLARARDYCLAALQWLVDDGVASQIGVQTSYFQADGIGIAITIARPTGLPVHFSYQWAWSA